MRPARRPPWLRAALADSLADLGRLPGRRRRARAAVAARHDRPVGRGAADRRAPPRPSSCSPGRCGRGARSSCTRSSPSRRRRCARPATRSSGSCSARPLHARCRLPCPTTPTWSWSATRPTRRRCCTRPARWPRWPGPGRTLVVDEAFADCVPGEPESLAGAAGRARPRRGPQPHQDVGAGRAAHRLRASRDAAMIERLARGAAAVGGVRRRPSWPRRPAAATTHGPRSNRWARHLADDRAHLAGPARGDAGSRRGPRRGRVLPAAAAADRADAPRSAARRGFAVRRGDTFPGLGPDWFRVAVRDPEHIHSFRRSAHGGAGMTLLDETLAAIRPLDPAAVSEARDRQGRLTKPRGSLGVLEDLSAQLAGLSGSCPPPLPEPAAVAVFAGDHGVHARGVTAVAAGGHGADGRELPRRRGGGERPRRPAGCHGARRRRGRGSRPRPAARAVDRQDPATARRTSRRSPRCRAPRRCGRSRSGSRSRATWSREGASCLLGGDMGIANTTAVRGAHAAFTGSDPATVTGRGAGIDGAAWELKVDSVGFSPPASTATMAGSRTTTRSVPSCGPAARPGSTSGWAPTGPTRSVTSG